MTSWKVFVAQLLTIIAGKSQTRKWALDKGVGLEHPWMLMVLYAHSPLSQRARLKTLGGFLVEVL